jgi:hypothetical protein
MIDKTYISKIFNKISVNFRKTTSPLKFIGAFGRKHIILTVLLSKSSLFKLKLEGQATVFN